MAINNDVLSGQINDNLDNWNDRAEVHAHGGYGDIDAIADDSSALSSVVLRDFEVLKPYLYEQSVRGKRLLHLQCHIGTDTLTWWRLGASEVHGLDFSPIALDYARRIADRAHANITYVLGDARHSSQVLPDRVGSFDVIVTSVGTITWLPDLASWAESIFKLLAPGGLFMIRDDHPLLFALDNSGLTVVHDYFSGTENSYVSTQSYTAGSQGKIEHAINHNWAHDFHEIVGELIGAGLVIEDLGEHKIADWQSLPILIFDEARQGWIMPKDQPSIPLTFSVVARKPLI